MISGNLTYKDIEYFFVLENNRELSLAPKEGFKDKSNAMFYEPLVNGIPGVVTPIHPIVENDYLVGISSETNEKIIMIPKSYQIERHNSVLKIIIKMVIKLNKKDKNAKINFYSSELNYIYNTKRTIKSFNPGKEEVDLKLKPCDVVGIKSEEFEIDGRKVKCNFDIDKVFSGKDLEHPLKIRTRLSFDFGPTDDYMFIRRIYFIAKKFIQFLTYRQNITFKEVYTSFLNEEELYEKNGVVLINDEFVLAEDEEIISKRFIPLDYVYSIAHNILQGISDNTLYTRHIPLSYDDSHTITESSFVLTTAGFEWEFSQLFPEGKAKKQARINAEAIVNEELIQLEDKYSCKNGRAKKIINKLHDFVDLTGLDTNLDYTFNQLDDITKIFANQLYRMNDEKVIYKDMGHRLAEQRNDFAHGNLNKDFSNLAMLDIIFLERVIYMMQLKRLGLDNYNIKNCINDLFQCHMIIDSDE